MNTEKIRRLLDGSGKYADITIEESESTDIMIINESVRPRESKSPGIRVRVLNSGWGIASSSKLGLDSDVSTINQLVDRAIKLSKVAKKRVKLAEIKVHETKSKTPFRTDPRNITIEQKISDLKEVETEMKMEKIKTASARYSDEVVKRVFLSNEGAHIESLAIRTSVSAGPVASKGSIMQRSHESVGNIAGYEIMKKAEGIGHEASKRAIALLKAEPPKAGKYTVVLSNDVAGVMSHEAVGHTVEADQKGSVFEDHVGKRVANDLVTIIDDPTIKAFGYYDYDDEGTKSERNTLIEKGILRGLLHSRETAGEKPKTGHPGNARAEDYSCVPQVRMSNTFFEKGDLSPEEVLDIRNGIYVKHCRGGQTDPSVGSYVFFMEEGWVIKDGEMSTPLRDISLKGSIQDTLFHVEAIGNDLVIEDPGYCGKGGQSVPVGDGGPHIRISDVTVGGR